MSNRSTTALGPSEAARLLRTYIANDQFPEARRYVEREGISPQVVASGLVDVLRENDIRRLKYAMYYLWDLAGEPREGLLTQARRQSNTRAVSLLEDDSWPPQRSESNR